VRDHYQAKTVLLVWKRDVFNLKKNNETRGWEKTGGVVFARVEGPRQVEK